MIPNDAPGHARGAGPRSIILLLNTNRCNKTLGAKPLVGTHQMTEGTCDRYHHFNAKKTTPPGPSAGYPSPVRVKFEFEQLINIHESRDVDRYCLLKDKVPIRTHESFWVVPAYTGAREKFHRSLHQIDSGLKEKETRVAAGNTSGPRALLGPLRQRRIQAGKR